MRILVTLAHPDDETFICGGTLARYAAEGARITLVTATRGEMGRRLGTPPFATRETLPDIREHELRDACQALGIADLRFLGLRDKTVDYYDPTELATRIGAILREVQPDVVITFHEAISGHSDHCAVGRAARMAFEAGINTPRLYYVLWREHAEQLTKAGATEDRVTTIDITGSAAVAKVKAFRAHRTQSQLHDWIWDDAAALQRLTGPEFFLQGSGPVRPGERDLLGRNP